MRFSAVDGAVRSAILLLASTGLLLFFPLSGRGMGGLVAGLAILMAVLGWLLFVRRLWALAEHVEGRGRCVVVGSLLSLALVGGAGAALLNAATLLGVGLLLGAAGLMLATGVWLQGQLPLVDTLRDAELDAPLPSAV